MIFRKLPESNAGALISKSAPGFWKKSRLKPAAWDAFVKVVLKNITEPGIDRYTILSPDL
jgi:hypothetical protein